MGNVESLECSKSKDACFTGSTLRLDDDVTLLYDGQNRSLLDS